MPIGHILESIDVEAASEIEAIRRKAEKRAEEILQNARARADGEVERFVAERINAEKVESMRRRNAAEMENRRGLAGVRRELFEQAFDTAHDRLETLRERDDYPTLLMAYIDEALDGLEPPCTIHVDERDVAHVPSGYRGCEVVGDLRIAGGAIIETADGRVKRSNTLEDRLALFRHDGVRQVSEVLYS